MGNYANKTVVKRLGLNYCRQEKNTNRLSPSYKLKQPLLWQKNMCLLFLGPNFCLNKATVKSKFMRSCAVYFTGKSQILGKLTLCI